MPPASSIQVVIYKSNYIGGSGPSMAPLGLLPPHDKQSWTILGELYDEEVAKYIVSPKDNSAHRKLIFKIEALNYVSMRTVERFEYDQQLQRAKDDFEEDERILTLAKAIKKRRSREKNLLAKKAIAVKGDGVKKSIGRPRKTPNVHFALLQRDASTTGDEDDDSDEEAVAEGEGGTMAMPNDFRVHNQAVQFRSTAAIQPSLSESESSPRRAPTLPRILVSPHKSHLRPDIPAFGNGLAGPPTTQKMTQTPPRLSMLSPGARKMIPPHRPIDVRPTIKTSGFPYKSRSMAGPLRTQDHVASPGIRALSAVAPSSSARPSLSQAPLSANSIAARSTVFVQTRQSNMPGHHLSRPLWPEDYGQQFEPSESLLSKESSRSRKASGRSSSANGVLPKAKSATFKSTKKSKQPPKKRHVEVVYEVKQILRDEWQQLNGELQHLYLIDWVGDWEPTWEPEANISEEALETYKNGDPSSASDNELAVGPKPSTSTDINRLETGDPGEPVYLEPDDENDSDF